jgi:hypothetical protein
MSHISKIELKIQSLEDLKQACHRLGFEFIENQQTYQWYGHWVGDQPLPEGITQDQLGKCDHAIRVPNCEYEIGVVKTGDHFILLWDSWKKGGLTAQIGQDAGILKQAYTAERVRSEARRKNYRVVEQKTTQGLRLVLTI